MNHLLIFPIYKQQCDATQLRIYVRLPPITTSTATMTPLCYEATGIFNIVT